MRFELKPLSPDAVPAALEKAARYRLLNEPMEAESICRDVLAVDPDQREALVTLFLALTDQLEGPHPRHQEASALLARFPDDYSRRYYHGILCERRAKAQWKRDPRISAVAHAGLLDAMAHFEAAAALRPPGNDDALLRWNTCARLLMDHPELCAEPEAIGHSFLE